MANPELRLPARIVVLRSTSEEDLAGLLALWNDGAVMHWVGFPEGLGYDEPKIRRWLASLQRHPDRFHFAAYAPDVGFCGEVYCEIDRRTRRAGLDIKFVPRAQGGGRSRDAFLTLIEWVFAGIEEADAVWTEPSESNLAARTLYYSCGLRPRERPADLPPNSSYWELSRQDWGDRQPRRSQPSAADDGPAAPP